MTDIVITHHNADPNGTTTRRSVVLQLESFAETEKKDYKANIPTYITRQNWANSAQEFENQKNRKIMDMMNLTHSFSLKCKVGSEEENTTLNGALTAVATTIAVASSANIMPASASKFGLIQVDSELVKYTAVSGNNLTGCVRGYNGTTAAAHLTGATVTHPAWHWRRQLIYINHAGGAVTIEFASTVNSTLVGFLSKAFSDDSSTSGYNYDASGNPQTVTAGTRDGIETYSCLIDSINWNLDKVDNGVLSTPLDVTIAVTSAVNL